MNDALNAAKAEQARRQNLAAASAELARRQPPAPAPQSPDVAANRTQWMERTEQSNDLGRSFGSGLVRGVTALADIPGQILSGGNRAAAFVGEKTGVMSPEFANALRNTNEGTPLSGDFVGGVADTVLPGARNYEPTTTAGQYAQTVGEFLPAAAPGGVASAVVNGVIPALASEAAGQATEGTSLEPFARVVGAIAAPVALNFGSRQWQRAFSNAQSKPSVNALRAEKSAAYKAVDDAGEVFQPREMQDLLGRARAAIDDGTYVAGVDTATDAVLDVLERQATQPTKLGQLDRIRQNLWKRYNANPEQTGILGAIDEIDDLIANRGPTNELMKAARLSNSRYKKAEMLDNAFQKAKDQTASTGSGGNILNKYRQAVTAIKNDPKRSKWFSDDELQVMQRFIDGDLPENVMRRIGKLAPGGNGLMLALNLGAAAVDPTMLTVSAGASAAKAMADGRAVRKADDLMTIVAGQTPRQAARGPASTAIPAASAYLANRPR